ncbi:hypothetical protein TRIUR3_29772 [Triticum urartu]|uniref:Uncharacterized protein n=1 Tax=Triticum urartu TaxID=4572 RepID=M8A1K0_TRIUA|nr:hypothetical protein TRIUR3_29772 [Triticum urartu]
MATKCPPEYTCTKYINQGPCDAAMMDCVSAYKGAGEGQCFPQGCRLYLRGNYAVCAYFFPYGVPCPDNRPPSINRKTQSMWFSMDRVAGAEKYFFLPWLEIPKPKCYLSLRESI